jgi:hypothetical protein
MKFHFYKEGGGFNVFVLRKIVLKKMLLTSCALFLLIYIISYHFSEVVLAQEHTSHFVHDHLLRYQLKRRHNTMKQIALDGVHAKSPLNQGGNCPKDRYLVITEYAFGRAGNNLIEFTHGLWLGKKLNATLIVPSWIQDTVFAPFNTSLLHSIYCFSFDSKLAPAKSNKDVTVYEITSENSFFLFQLKKEFAFPDLIPDIMSYQYISSTSSNNEGGKSSSASTFLDSSLASPLINELSKHFLSVYSGLWCCPTKKLLLLTEFFLSYYMKGSLGYTSVHKRQLEGGCAKVLASVTKPSDFSSKEIPINHPDWTTNSLSKFHPICEMTVSFIQEVLALNHRNSGNLSNVFIAYDGRGDISSYEKANIMFSHSLSNLLFSSTSSSSSISDLSVPHNDLSSHLFHKVKTAVTDEKTLKELLKYLDMLLAIHSEFFILNPRSTFSFQIYVIRVALGLQSVPVMRENDFYMQKVPEELISNNRSLWVSWISVQQAAASIGDV